MSKSEKALIYKDIKETVSTKRVILPMAIVPLVLIVLMPLAVVIGAGFVEMGSEVFSDVKTLIAKLPAVYSSYTPAQLLIKLSLDIFFPSYFLIIPIMCSAVIGASSFVGEKEHKTMESLLYTPITMEQLLRAKVLGVFIPSYVITMVSFLLMGIIYNVAGVVYFDRLIFPDLKWMIILLWISPAVNLLSLIFTVLVSAKSETFQEAQQISGMLVLPIVLLMVGQMTGVIMLNSVIMLVAGAILLVLDFLLIKKAAAGFRAEKLI